MSAEKPQPYPKPDPNPHFPAIEEEVLAYWQKHNIFEKSVENRPAKQNGESNEFIFYDGPPFANGLPHYGHLLTGFVKDLFARYQTMQGKRVERRFGWDCHGLPAEMAAEKELGVSGRAQIMEYGIEKFNAHCRTSVMKYTNEWRDYVTRQARWVDFDNDYKTMDFTFMESVMWAFKQLYDKGWVYEAYRVMPYSWAAETPLSNFETRLDNSYRDRTDKAVTVAFELAHPLEGHGRGTDSQYVLAWTTTPWTLPSNLALAVSGNMPYRVISGNGKAVIVGAFAEAGYRKALQEFLKPATPGAVVETSHLCLRPFTEEDWDDYKRLQSDPKVAGSTSDGVLPEDKLRVEFDRLLAMQAEHADAMYAVIEKKSGAFIGRAGFDHRDFGQFDETGKRTLEVRYALLGDYWGQGYGKELTEALLQWGLLHLDVDYFIAGSAESNEPTRRILQRYGFEKQKDVPYKNQTVEYWQLSVGQARQQFSISGKQLIESVYQPLFPYFADHPNAFRILDGSDFVEEGSGTGIVHMAPGFGEDDQRVCEAAGIAIVCPVDGAGKFTDEIFDIVGGQKSDSALSGVPLASQKTSQGTNKQTPHPNPLPGGEGISLRGLNVLAATEKDADEPYTPEQLQKYGLVNLRIAHWLKLTGKLVQQEDYTHTYPHCWRTDKPLIYKAVPSWYVEVTKFRDRMVELNQQINWIPSHVKDGLFGKWLEGARDWSISRNRFWGSPIPVWKSDNPKSKAPLKVFGKVEELEAFFGPYMASAPHPSPLPKGEGEDESSPSGRGWHVVPGEGITITDLHRPYIDDLIAPDDPEQPDNPRYFYRRVEEVFDCWFESGSMPYAQVHYPFENADWFESHNPADFIVEYVAQTRGWFYTLMVLGTALFDRPPFLNCICHGVVSDEQGRKLSKSLNNYPDPREITDKHGADALRWFMMSSPIMRGMELHIDKEGNFIRDAVRLYVKPIWNAYNFFCLYANADGVTAKLDTSSTHLMDCYILSKLNVSVREVKQALDAYDTPAACAAVSGFFEVLNNWYIRRNRERFWGSEYNADKQAAYDTLYTALHVMCRAASPLLPMVTEAIYRGLTNEASVHLADWPTVSELVEDAALVRDMDFVRDVCNAALSVRNKQNIRVRQPLNTLTIVSGNVDGLAIISLFEQIIKDEINVKNIEFQTIIYDFAELKLKIDFPKVGARLGPKMKEIIAASKQDKWQKLEDGRIQILDEVFAEDEVGLLVDPKDKDASASLSTNDALVVLDLKLTDDLIAEGVARDVVRMVQQARKDAGLEVSDRIRLAFDAPETVLSAVTSHKDYIAEQTLAVEVLNALSGDVQYKTKQKLDDNEVEIGITKAA